MIPSLPFHCLFFFLLRCESLQIFRDWESHENCKPHLHPLSIAQSCFCVDASWRFIIFLVPLFCHNFQNILGFANSFCQLPKSTCTRIFEWWSSISSRWKANLDIAARTIIVVVNVTHCYMYWWRPAVTGSALRDTAGDKRLTNIVTGGC